MREEEEEEQTRHTMKRKGKRKTKRALDAFLSCKRRGAPQRVGMRGCSSCWKDEYP